MSSLRFPAPTRAAARRAGRAGRGVAMVEVLVAVVLLSFGLVGLVALQARATQYSIEAEDANRAALLAGELASAMWTSGTTSLPADTVTAWSNRVADTTGGGLPNGSGSVAVDAGIATITVSWRAPRAPSGSGRRYQTQVMLP